MFFDPHNDLEHAPIRTEAQLHALYRKLVVMISATPLLQDFASPLAHTLINFYGASGIIVGRTQGFSLQILTSIGCFSHMEGTLIEIQPAFARKLMANDEAYIFNHEELRQKYPIDDITLGAQFDALIIAPMFLEGRPYGFISLIAQKPGFYSMEDVESLRQITRFCSIILSGFYKASTQSELQHYERVYNMTMPLISALQSYTIDMLQTLAHLRESYITNNYRAMVDPMSQAFARIEAIAKTTQDLRAIADFGKTPELLTASVRLDELLESVREYNDTRLEDSHIEVMMEIESDMPAIEADFSMLWQAIHEIMLNAMDALETLPDAAQRHLLVHAYAAPNLLQIDINDNGPGVAPEDMNKLCEPGFTTRQGHKGLGLAKAKLVIMRCNGEMWLEPGKSGGMTVHISFADEEHTPQQRVF